MRSKLRIVAAGGWLCLGLVAGGCATAPAPPPGSVSSPMPGRRAEPVRPQPTAGASPSAPAPVPAPSPPGGTAVGTTASGGTITLNFTQADGMLTGLEASVHNYATVVDSILFAAPVVYWWLR